MAIEIDLGDKMTYFMIRKCIGHEPIHDFNPVGAGSRYIKLNKQLENLKLDGLFQEGGNTQNETKIETTSSAFDNNEINTYMENIDINTYINTYLHMDNDSPSHILNNIALKFKIVDSSETVPLSDKVHNEFSCKEQ